MRADRKQTILFIIILLVLSMGIGYAFLTTTLSIDGVSDIDAANWDIYFDDIIIAPTSVSGDKVITPATISQDGTSISYHVKLEEPGDYYSFLFFIVNDGTLDAEIDDIIITVNDVQTDSLPSFLSYFLAYEGSDIDVAVGDRFDSGDMKDVYFSLEYRTDVTPAELPTEDYSLDIVFSIVFVQAEPYSYYYSSTNTEFDQLDPFSLPNSFSIFNTPQEAINDFNNDVYVRYKVLGNRVKEVGIGFKYNNQYYYLKGDRSSETENKDLIRGLFGDSNCYTSGQQLICNYNEYAYIVSGSVLFVKGSLGCVSYSSGERFAATCGDVML